MIDKERYSHDFDNDGIPAIPPEVIEAFKNKPLNLIDEQRYIQLHRADLARWLYGSAEKNCHEPEQKRAYLLGALSVLGLLKFSKENADVVQLLERLYESESHVDESHIDPSTTG